MTRTPVGLFAVCAILFSVAGCGQQPLPRVDLPALQELVQETAAQDRVLVIDFWATWCAPCVELFPSLHAGLHQVEGVRAVTVTLDSPGEYESKAIAFLRQHGAMQDAYMLEPDSDAQLAVVAGMGERWTDLVVPAILIYDKDGKLAGEFFEGATPDDIIGRVKALIGAAE